MPDFDKHVQPDLVINIDEGKNQNYTAAFKFAPKKTMRPAELPGGITFQSVETRIVCLRHELTQWSRKYNELLDQDKTDPLSCAPDLVRPLWNFLAKWGRDMYMDLFNILKPKSQIAQLAQTIRGGLKTDDLIQIDAPRLIIPWGLLYDGEIPADDDPYWFEQMFAGFWGFRYQIELYPPSTSGDDDDDYINLRPYLDNTDNTRLTVAINEKSDLEYRTGQMAFFDKLPTRFQFSSNPATPASLAINKCRDTVIKSMMAREEPQHLFYFYCHHAKGDGVNLIYGSQDYKQRTRIMMEGESAGAIDLKELKGLRNDKKIASFQYPPLIFLNACDSGQLEMGDPASFMEFFLKDLRSVDYIGTEANVPALFADEYGKSFVEQFLQAKSVGEILLDLGRRYARDHYNPFGLYYSLFGFAQIKLNKSVEEIKP